MSHATRISETQDWLDKDYFWRPPDSLVRAVTPLKSDWHLAEYAPAKPPLDPMPGLSGSALHSTGADEYLMVSTNSAGAAITKIMSIGVPGLSLSPDGRWLVCRAQYQGKAGIAQREIDTGKQVFCANPEEGEYRKPVWLRDSSATIDVLDTPTGNVLKVRTMRSPDLVRRVRVQGNLGDTLIGTTASGQLLSSGTYSGRMDQGSLSLCSITGDSATPKPMESHVPRGRIVRGTQISPSGDRLAWVTEAAPVFDPKRLPSWAQRPLGVLVLPSVEIWVSRLDGSGWERIGSAPLRDGKTNLIADIDTQSLRWLPDGKHLSFISHEALWVVPVL